ncbi:MAG: hypothetical protein ACP5NC_02220 [Nitrososphaeria archaeon]
MKSESATQENEFSREISCFKCSHFPVCEYFREIQQVTTVPEADKFQPFRPEGIARLCRFYLPDPFS